MKIFQGIWGCLIDQKHVQTSNQSGLSIAATPIWFGHLQAKNEIIEEKVDQISTTGPPKNTHKYKAQILQAKIR